MHFCGWSLLIGLCDSMEHAMLLQYTSGICQTLALPRPYPVGPGQISAAVCAAAGICPGCADFRAGTPNIWCTDCCSHAHGASNWHAGQRLPVQAAGRCAADQHALLPCRSRCSEDTGERIRLRASDWAAAVARGQHGLLAGSSAAQDSWRRPIQHLHTGVSWQPPELHAVCQHLLLSLPSLH